MPREITPAIVFNTFAGGIVKINFPTRMLTYFGTITDVSHEPFPVDGNPASFRLSTNLMLGTTTDGQYFLSEYQEVPPISLVEATWYGNGQRLGCVRKPPLAPEQQEITLFQPGDKDVEKLLRPFNSASATAGTLDQLISRYEMVDCGFVSLDGGLIPVRVRTEAKPPRKTTGGHQFHFVKDRVELPSAIHVRELNDVFILNPRSGHVTITAEVQLWYQNERPCLVKGLSAESDSLKNALRSIISQAISKRT